MAATGPQQYQAAEQLLVMARDARTAARHGDPAAIMRPRVTTLVATAQAQAALALADEQRAREFVARTLGELAGADRELRDTLCVYIGEQFSAARAARACTPTATPS